jgi:hypothetical protein
MYFASSESDLLKVEKLMNRAFDVGDPLVGYSLFCVIRSIISKPYAEIFVPAFKELVNENGFRSPFRNTSGSGWREEYIRQLSYLSVILSENQPTSGELLRTLAFGLNSCLEEQIVQLCLSIDVEHPHPFEDENQRVRHHDMINRVKRQTSGYFGVRKAF